MIKKQNIWFISLFSLILVLSVYYLNLKDTGLDKINLLGNENVKTTINQNENSYLLSLRISDDEKLLKTMEELQTTLNNTEATVLEKNEAYETLKELNLNKGKEMELEKIIKEKFNYDSYIKINGDKINVTIASDEHNKEIANNIIKEIQNKYEVQKYITVKFKK